MQDQIILSNRCVYNMTKTYQITLEDNYHSQTISIVEVSSNSRYCDSGVCRIGIPVSVQQEF